MRRRIRRFANLLRELAARAYLADGDEAIHTTHGFLVYPIATLGTGAKPVVAPETNYTASVDAILAAVTKKTKIVFLANPNNPTGTYISFDEVKRLQRSLPPHVLLVLDAAYAEYVRRNDYEFGHRARRHQRQRRHDPHVLQDPRARGAAPRLDVWSRACCGRDKPRPRSIQRQCAGNRRRVAAIEDQIAAIEDHDHQERARQHNTRWLGWLAQELEALGLKVTPSVANFLLIHFPQTKGRSAKEANDFLTARGLILRQVGAYKLPNALRMSVGNEEANRLVVAALKEFLAKA